MRIPNNFLIPIGLLLISINANSQSILDLRCDLYSEYVLDSTYKEINSMRFIPIENDSLLLYESITIVKKSKRISRRKFNKQINFLLNSYPTYSGGYIEELNNGKSNALFFRDFLFFIKQ